MANWAISEYIIKGNQGTLKRIERAILDPKTAIEDERLQPESWVISALNIPIKERKSYKDLETGELVISGDYLRGFIQLDSVEIWQDGTLRFSAEEAWGLTDFVVLLETHLPDIKIWWYVEEPNMGIYTTNDICGKYFSYNYYVDTCIEGDYQSEYFVTESAMYEWLSDISKGKVNSEEEAEKFNEENIDNNDFIAINKIKRKA